MKTLFALAAAAAAARAIAVAPATHADSIGCDFTHSCSYDPR